MYSLARFVITVAITLLLDGCASYPLQQNDQSIGMLASHDRVIALDINDCRESLGNNMNSSDSELDAANIKFLSWNIKKGQKSQWQNDLQNLSNDKDLVLIQEAVLGSGITQAIDNIQHWSFGNGYQTQSQVTGVMTYSKHEPLAHCNLQNREPWLGTPKATTVTEYGLSGTDQSLIVVNIHAINFTFGVSQFQNQIDQIRKILFNHNGPVIVSGDFNTWREKRMQILESLAADLELAALSFQQDHRKKVFGYTLDHIYAKGLMVKNTATYPVISSDHNPLMAEFKLLAEL